MPDPMFIQIAVLMICVFGSAYFSATETAFSSLNKTRLKTMVEKGNRKAALALNLSEQYDKLLSTILIGNNIVNIAAASIGTLLFVALYGDIGATISTAVITVVVLIFGEVTPKSIAKDSPEKFAMFSAPFLRMLMVVLTPANFLFTQWKKLVRKIFKTEDDSKMSQEELLMLVDEVEQEGSIDEDEGELLRNAIGFKEREAEDILTHRVDLEAVCIDDPKEDIALVFSNSKFSRLLVYKENIDDIVGVIHIKDFYVGSGINPMPMENIVTPAVFVPKNEKLDRVMEELQKKKSHIAVVLDEYGGTYGIVTMEDILEELVGEIWDEHDEASEEIRVVSSDTYRVDALVEMNTFDEYFNVETETEMVSLSGWIMEQLGRVPDVGDRFTYENLEVTVLSTVSHRVQEAEIKVLPVSEADGESDKEKEFSSHE